MFHKQLNSSEADIPVKVAQLLTSQKGNRKAMQTMNEKLLYAEANELLQQPTKIHAGILISKVFTNRSMQEIIKLSAIITGTTRSMPLHISLLKTRTNYNASSLVAKQSHSI